MFARRFRLLAVMACLVLVASSCGDDDTDGSGSGTGSTTDAIEVAAGTVLDLGACPDDWSATQGVDGDEIRLGISLPESGPLASFASLADGMRLYFDHINETDPIGDQEIVLINRDDAYDSGRAKANVEEMIDSDDIFAFIHMFGTPANVAVRPVTEANCVPQLFNSSGAPDWGDPANHPWTVGNQLNYATEARIWCEDIVAELGEGATVAALIIDNDFGKAYERGLDACVAEGQIELVSKQLHAQDADGVTDEMTTLIATDAQALVVGTTGGSYCPPTVAAVAASEWRPLFYMSYTCNNLAAFFTPVQDATAALADSGAGVRMANSIKVCGDPAWAGDPAIVLIEEVLATGGVTCAEGNYSTGVLFAQYVVDILRAASEQDGGLDRVNLMRAVWNADLSNDTLLGGSLKLDGVNDAYWVESAQIQQVVVDGGALTFAPLGDVIDLEGQGGTFSG